MNNLRLTIVMFMLAVVLASVMLVGWHQGADASMTSPGRTAPVIDPATFAPAGLKQSPWTGQASAAAKPQSPADNAAKPEAPAPESLALIELFTSEGCSSCPPADQLLNELAAPGPGSRRVLCIAYHVDYWDHLGWKDPFASAAFTQRQRDYAAALKTDRVYTPQSIVNGTNGFVGSDGRKMTEAIDAALAAPPQVRIDAALGQTINPGQTLTVPVKVSPVGQNKLADDLRIFAAITEDKLTSQVTRGENEGRKLNHEAVCRLLIDARPDASGSAQLELVVPAGINAAHARIIIWAQQGQAGRVLGAAASPARH